MTRITRIVCSYLSILLPFSAQASEAVEPLRLAVIGLNHGHVEGVLWNATSRDDLTIVGIYDPNYKLFEKFRDKYKLDPNLFYADLDQMLDETKPEAASVMTPISEHLDVVKSCAPRGVHTLLEKPLAYTLDDALAMQALGKEHGVHVLTNYETSWYASVRETKKMIASGEAGLPTRVIFRHGHKGPIEIGCSEEFVHWLADPEFNGGGAIVDFGCYGANIMTWFMGQAPLSVTAITQQIKPDLYPKVDDDATILLTYPNATAVIQASWSWTHDNKELDVHTTKMSIHAEKWDSLTVRKPDQERAARTPAQKPAHLQDEWTYLRTLVKGNCEIDPLSSTENNIIVAAILDAAIESARTGETVTLRAAYEDSVQRDVHSDTEG